MMSWASRGAGLATAAEVTAVTPVSPRIPIATYRLQFNASFTFRDARSIVGYLEALGISDCYASSYLRAVPGSGHGYDIADPTMLNPEIGTDEEYWSWVGALRQAGMGHILDVVPNHMGIARSANPWWMDVLENGPSSRYARFFDIEWKPIKDELADKVLLPILGDYYGSVLENQQLTLEFRDGAFVVRYGDDWLPLAPDTYPHILEAALSEWPGIRRRRRPGRASEHHDRGGQSAAARHQRSGCDCRSRPGEGDRQAAPRRARRRERRASLKPSIAR